METEETEQYEMSKEAQPMDIRKGGSGAADVGDQTEAGDVHQLLEQMAHMQEA